jgi:hypothetical protein
MKDSLRNILAVLLGLVTGFVLITTAEYLASGQFQMPNSLKMEDKVGMAAWMNSLPNTAFFSLIGGYFVSTLLGSLVAAAVAGNRPTSRAYIVTAILMVGGVFNFINIPHPTWVVMATIVGFIVAGLLGSMIGSRIWAGRAINKAKQ